MASSYSKFYPRGGGLGGAQCPPSSTPDPNKTSVGCKDETAQRGYFQQVDCFVASLVGSCSSSLLWVVAIAVVVVVVAVGSRCFCCGSIQIIVWRFFLLQTSFGVYTKFYKVGNQQLTAHSTKL